MLSKRLLTREGESAYAKEKAEKRMLGHVLTDHPSRYHNIMQILPDVSPEDGDHGSYGNSYGDYSPALQKVEALLRSRYLLISFSPPSPNSTANSSSGREMREIRKRSMKVFTINT